MNLGVAKGAVLGAFIGLGLAVVIWWLNGFFIGMSMDYEMYRHYDRVDSFWRKLLYVVPIGMAIGAWKGHKTKKGPYG